MGEGERLTGRSDPLGRRLEYTDNPRTTAVDKRSTPSVKADRQEPLPTFRCPGLPRVFPDHLITYLLSYLLSSGKVMVYLVTVNAMLHVLYLSV